MKNWFGKYFEGFMGAAAIQKRLEDFDVEAFVDRHVNEGTFSRSPAQRPFNHDWGIELPTQVIWFDGISIGSDWPDGD